MSTFAPTNGGIPSTQEQVSNMNGTMDGNFPPAPAMPQAGTEASKTLW